VAAAPAATQGEERKVEAERQAEAKQALADVRAATPAKAAAPAEAQGADLRIGRHPVWCGAGANATPAQHPRGPEMVLQARKEAPLNASRVVTAKGRGISRLGCGHPKYSRLANGLIIYAVCSLSARTLGNGALPTFNFNGRTHEHGCQKMEEYFVARFAKDMPKNEKDPPTGTKSLALAALLPPCAKGLPGGVCNEYFQSYNLLRGHRGFVQQQLELSAMAKQLGQPGRDDFVIHLRLQHLFLTVEYFTGLFRAREALLGPVEGLIWILTEDPKHELAREVARAVGGRVRETQGCGALNDMTFLMQARHLVLGPGSYSWFAGFTSDAVEIHMPVSAKFVEKDSWANSAHLFVDDDARYIYHDWHARNFFLAAGELADPATQFGSAVHTNPPDRLHAEPGSKEEYAVASSENGLVLPCDAAAARYVAEKRGIKLPLFL